MDSYYPVEVQFVNNSSNSLEIKSIVSAKESTSIFLVEGKKLKPGNAVLARFSYQDADTIRDGLYLIDGYCENNVPIRSDLSAIDESMYESNARLTILIEGCE